MRGRRLRESAAAQAAERECRGGKARIAAHRVNHGRSVRAGRGDLVPGGEYVKHFVVQRHEVDVGDGLAACERRLVPVQRLARLFAAAYHHQRAAAFERQQQLAGQQKQRLAARQAGPRADRLPRRP